MADYTYFNINPYGIEEEDCVCRAITAATGVEYYVIDNLRWWLNRMSVTNFASVATTFCWRKYLSTQ